MSGSLPIEGWHRPNGVVGHTSTTRDTQDLEIRMPKTARKAPRSTTAVLSGPASLVHPEARRGMACRNCGSSRVTQIGMTLTDGSAVQFAFCRVCEHRSWVQDDAALAFDRVLDKTRKIA
jgi:hypothetical protein